MNKIFLLSLAVFLFSGISIHSQEKYQIGSDLRNLRQTQGAYFDYSDPSNVNIKIQVWGYVKYPGYYVVPINTSLSELFSYAGGPLVDAKLDDIRILKTAEDSTVLMTRYNYNDLMWEESLKTQISFPRLEAGDIVVIPGEPRYFIRQDISFYLSILTAVISSAALIISITR
ncbi:MAG: SLBB domain-containing protein [Ignavibacterium album]|nr:SLBB domain-containing protein [Ignavibacterium album]MBI5663330.1 SLBB domain-containing protein [Ignavibacterium album]